MESKTGFGAGFRKAREARGISIDGIAAETRIGARFLRAIESEDFAVLPGGLFNRGFIRAYAERLGLDANQAVEDYQRLAQDRETKEPEPTSYRPAGSATQLWPLGLGIVVIGIVLGIYTLLFRDTSAPQKPPQKAPENRTETPPPKPPEPVKPPDPPAAKTNIVEPAAAEPPKTVVAEKPPEPVKTAGPPIVLEMQVLELTWVQVLTDGASAEASELQPGATRRYTAQKTVEMRIGNAGGLALKVNDRDVPSLGKHGEVRQFTITPENAAKLSFAAPGN